MTGRGPLEGYVVVDLSRMLPGAILARVLLDLGARLIKVEEPSGDPLRHVPPLVGDVSAAFAALLPGAESIALDLRAPDGAAAARRLVRHADVVVESFRPGTLAGWGLSRERLRAGNPGLVICSLTGFGATGGRAQLPAHDLNFTAFSGLLAMLGGLPRVQLADVTGGLLAVSAILAALLARGRTGRGADLDQPLAAAALPHLAWAWADLAAGAPGLWDDVLAGACPAYRRYACADGRELAVAALEPKFWSALVVELALPHLAGAGLDTGEVGARAAAELAARFATAPAAEWLARLAARDVPISPVHTLAEAMAEPIWAEAGWVTPVATAAGPRAVPGPFLPSLGRTPDRPAPALDQHGATIRRELGLDA